MLIAIAVGISTGSIYGLTAMGLTLTYRTTGIFNLAHGAIGMFGTYLFWLLWREHGVPLAVALPLVLLVLAPALGAVLHFAVFRWVREKPVAVALVATIAVLVGLQGTALALFGSDVNNLKSMFPFRLIGITSEFNVTSEQIGTVIVTLLVAGCLYLVLQRTRAGLAMRAVVDNRRLAEIGGTDTERVQVLSWALSSSVATLAGILIAPFTQLGVYVLTLIVIQAMAASVVGRLQSLPLTYLGGLALGLIEAFLAQFLPTSEAALGLKGGAAFLVLYLAVVLGSTVFRVFSDDVAVDVKTGLLGGEAPPSRLPPLVVLFALLALAIPFTSGYQTFLLASALVASIAFQGFVLVSGYGGQVLLCMASLMGTGAIFYGRMVGEWHLPVAVAFLGAPLVAVLLGLAVGLPAVRIRGLPLALLTLAFGLFVDRFLFILSAFVGGSAGSTYAAQTVPRPSLFGVDLNSEKAFAYLALGLALLAALSVRNLASGRSGRVLVAAKNSEVGAESFGTSVRRAKLALFIGASFLGGLGGVLVAIQVQTVSPVQFNVNQSILFLAVAVLGGVGNAQGAVVGALLLYLVPEVLSGLGLTAHAQLVMGVGAVAVLVARRGGVADMLSRPLLRMVRSPRERQHRPRQPWPGHRAPGAAGTLPTMLEQAPVGVGS